MKKLSSTLPNMVLSLTIIAAFAGCLLGIMYEVTKEPIAEQQKENRIAAIKKVAPAFDNDPEADAWDYKSADGDAIVYPAYKGGTLVGAAVKATSMNGFSGEITVMCGFDKDGAVRDYEVLHQAETPGLGAKMQMWFRDPKGARSVLGRNPGRESFYVTQDKADHGQVDAITAATISSRAFLETLRNAYKAYLEYQEKSNRQKNEQVENNI